MLSLSNQQLNQLNICWNNVYTEVFKMHQWESVKELQWFCERLDLKHIVDKRKLFFWKGLLKVIEYCLIWTVYALEGICPVVLQV